MTSAEPYYFSALFEEHPQGEVIILQETPSGAFISVTCKYTCTASPFSLKVHVPRLTNAITPAHKVGAAAPHKRHMYWTLDCGIEESSDCSQGLQGAKKGGYTHKPTLRQRFQRATSICRLGEHNACSNLLVRRFSQRCVCAKNGFMLADIQAHEVSVVALVFLRAAR